VQPVVCRPAVLELRIPQADPLPAQDKDSAPRPPAANNEDKPDPVCERPGDRETFGTAVVFVRNPAEAARRAGAEHKLTFLLHVSGNFEDNRFT
jgi:hypothetical protein